MDIEPAIEISVEDNAWKDFVNYMNNLGLGEIYDMNDYTGISSLRDRGVMMYYVFSSGKPNDQRMKDLLAELESIDDDIFNLIKKFKDTMFFDLEEDEQRFVTQIQTDHPNLVDPNKTKPDADPFIISIAKFRHLTVITMENPRSPFNIPQVCGYYNFNCVDILDFFRELGITF